MHADDDPEVEWQRDAMAVSALRAWLLAEEAHPRGGVPDEVLLHLQHHVEELLGPHALFAAGNTCRLGSRPGRTWRSWPGTATPSTTS